MAANSKLATSDTEWGFKLQRMFPSLFAVLSCFAHNLHVREESTYHPLAEAVEGQEVAFVGRKGSPSSRWQLSVEALDCASWR